VEAPAVVVPGRRNGLFVELGDMVVKTKAYHPIFLSLVG
jgi:hypothetical protein